MLKLPMVMRCAGRTGIGCALVLAICQPAGAQVQAAARAASSPGGVDLGSVVVTGLRGAAENADTFKQNAEQVIDSAVAETVGKFPDNNVAEALARIPGIQIRRDSDEGNTVLIRGLPQIATLLNGRELSTTTRRFVLLADVPASMLKRADVYKSQSADQIEGGIAGVIDVRTYRPFDFAGSTLNLSARGVYADKSKATDPSVAALASNRWQTGVGEVGALLGVSYQRRRFHEERAFDTDPVDQTGAIPAFDGTNQTATGPFVMGLIPIKGDRRRTAFNGALQWRPSPTLQLYAEGLVSRLRNDFEFDYFVGLPWLGDRASNVVPLIPGTNQVQTLSARNAFTITSTQADSGAQDTHQYAIGGQWEATPRLRLKTEVSATGSLYDWRNPILDTSTVVPNVFVDTNRNGTPHLEYTGIDMSRPSNYQLFGFFDRYGQDRSRAVDWRGDVEFTPAEPGVINGWLGGLRSSRHSAESIKSFEGNAPAPGGIGVASIPGLGCVSEPMTGGGPDYGLRQWATPCAGFLLDDTALVRQTITGSASPRPLDPGSFFRDDESTYAGYLKARIGGLLAGTPFDGALGVRVVRTRQEAQGNDSTGGVYTATRKSSSYTDVLPSLNLRFTLDPALLARLSAGRTVTRPDFADLNPGVAYVAPSVTLKGTGSGGNPDLKSVKSNNLDATLEWYFGRADHLQATLFEHRFTGYVLRKTAVETFNGQLFDVTRPYNSDSGTLRGVELGYQQFYDKLPGWLSGLGLQANFTYSEGRTTSDGSTFATPGLSRTSYNLIGMYERSGWSARVAYNWRSRFVDIYDHGGPGLDLIVRPLAQLDASLAYKLSATTTLIVEATNLLDNAYRDYWKDPSVYPRDTRRYDRTLAIGVSWKL